MVGWLNELADLELVLFEPQDSRVERALRLRDPGATGSSA